MDGSLMDGSMMNGSMMGASMLGKAKEEFSTTDRRRNTNENLQRSIHLLEDAVGTQRKIRTLKQQKQVTPLRFNLSQRDTSLDKTHTPTLTNMSMGESFSEIAATSFTTKMEPPEFTSNITMLMNDDPGFSASTSVFTDFMHCLKRHPNDNQIFDLLTEYEYICREQVSMLKGLVKSAAPHQHKFNQTLSTLSLLEQECQTWTLLRSLFREREKNASMDEETVHSLALYKSDRDVAEECYKHDPSITRAQLVVDWLERAAVEDVDKFYGNPASFMDKAVAWENTLHKLERKKTATVSHGRRLIDQMDPDAPFRQSGNLDDLDKEDESRLLKYLFVCVRAGQLDKAQETCVQCGQPWRAATFEGWKLHHDPNYNSLQSDSVLGPVEGNHLCDLWRLVCWRMIEDPAVSVYEKAIYGSRSGHLASMLAVCNTWQDQVWAYHKAMIDHALEAQLRVNYRGARPRQELPSLYQHTQLDPQTIFRDIEACDNEVVQQESKEWYALIQKHVILDDFNGLMELFYNWTQLYRDQLPKHLLRFIIHLILYLRRTGSQTTTDHCTAVIEAYIRLLIDDEHTDLVATYTSSLPPNAQVNWYAKFLQEIEERERREYCLRLAEESHLDVHAITKLVVENIRNEGGGDGRSEPGIEQTITQDDLRKISAVDWLVFDKTQRAEAMSQANAIMRSFLALRKTSACREVMDKMSQDSVTTIYKNWKRQTGSDDLPPHLDSIVREYTALSAYLDAMEAFNQWFDFLHHNRPARPVEPGTMTFTDRVAFEHRNKQYDIETERWTHTLDQYTKSSKEHIYNVLMFPQGWMTNVHEMCEGDEGRLVQMSRLRQLCIPQMCVLLHSVLHNTHQYAECLRLADLIASDTHRLYKEFQTTELQRLLELMRDSSLALLANNSDPLGYSSS